MATEDDHGSVPGSYCWDACFIPNGTDDRESCMRPVRHLARTFPRSKVEEACVKVWPASGDDRS